MWRIFWQNCELHSRRICCTRHTPFSAKLLSTEVNGDGTLNSFTLSREHQMLRDMCRNFANNELTPIAAELDRRNQFPKKQIEKLGEMGLLGVNVSEKYGGSALDSLSLALAVEELSRGCAGTGVIVSVHNCLYANLLERFGNDEQKQKYLTPYTKGQLGCFALSEPEAGSDVGAISTTAVLKNGQYILNGVKSWVTSGVEGNCSVIFATVDKSLKHRGITAFIVPMDTKGISRGKKEEKLGIRASSTCSFYLDNVQIPQANILGSVGNGFKIAMQQLDRARVGIAAQALGIAQAALELAVGYALQRKAFGRPISDLQAVKLRIGEMSLRLEAARLLVWRAALACDETGRRPTKEVSMGKLAASEAATFVSHSAIQILGGMGYVNDMPAERHYRDARITEIYGGVSDVQRLLVGDLIIKEYTS